nr:probable LRR receptor-like serine/threonine-protein kinase At3g47570 [Ipomoea batatas]
MPYAVSIQRTLLPTIGDNDRTIQDITISLHRLHTSNFGSSLDDLMIEPSMNLSLFLHESAIVIALAQSRRLVATSLRNTNRQLVCVKPDWFRTNQSPTSSSTGLRFEISQTSRRLVATEYGIGSKASKAGDVYSFGILILEMLIERRPTDELFKDGLNLHSYAKAGLAERGVEIADPKILQERVEQIQIRNKGKSCKENDKFDVCLVCMIKVGVACSVEFPADRMKIRDVVGELNKARKSFLK